ncbi:expressed unknown protein [Seminavis robusta]|uniref:Uncharacterized protein n=1 Tax=Seminavis robusta TaxID=568900 RepID=A0A9N8HJ30_9STRA|nr:expressed unknown protein [Seminavis robusta]|eukprot:Sro631_g178520.1 n/a (1800) ;mRNA; f:31334-36733
MDPPGQVTNPLKEYEVIAIDDDSDSDNDNEVEVVNPATTQKKTNIPAKSSTNTSTATSQHRPSSSSSPSTSTPKSPGNARSIQGWQQRQNPASANQQTRYPMGWQQQQAIRPQFAVSNPLIAANSNPQSRANNRFPGNKNPPFPANNAPFPAMGWMVPNLAAAMQHQQKQQQQQNKPEPPAMNLSRSQKESPPGQQKPNHPPNQIQQKPPPSQQVQQKSSNQNQKKPSTQQRPPNQYQKKPPQQLQAKPSNQSQKKNPQQRSSNQYGQNTLPQSLPKVPNPLEKNPPPQQRPPNQYQQNPQQQFQQKPSNQLQQKTPQQRSPSQYRHKTLPQLLPMVPNPIPNQKNPPPPQQRHPNQYQKSPTQQPQQKPSNQLQQKTPQQRNPNQYQQNTLPSQQHQQRPPQHFQQRPPPQQRLPNQYSQNTHPQYPQHPANQFRQNTSQQRNHNQYQQNALHHHQQTHPQHFPQNRQQWYPEPQHFYPQAQQARSNQGFQTSSPPLPSQIPPAATRAPHGRPQAQSPPQQQQPPPKKQPTYTQEPISPAAYIIDHEREQQKRRKKRQSFEMTPSTSISEIPTVLINCPLAQGPARSNQTKKIADNKRLCEDQRRKEVGHEAVAPSNTPKTYAKIANAGDIDVPANKTPTAAASKPQTAGGAGETCVRPSFSQNASQTTSMNNNTQSDTAANKAQATVTSKSSTAAVNHNQASIAREAHAAVTSKSQTTIMKDNPQAAVKEAQATVTSKSQTEPEENAAPPACNMHSSAASKNQTATVNSSETTADSSVITATQKLVTAATASATPASSADNVGGTASINPTTTESERLQGIVPETGEASRLSISNIPTRTEDKSNPSNAPIAAAKPTIASTATNNSRNAINDNEDQGKASKGAADDMPSRKDNSMESMMNASSVVDDCKDMLTSGNVVGGGSVQKPVMLSNAIASDAADASKGTATQEIRSPVLTSAEENNQQPSSVTDDPTKCSASSEKESKPDASMVQLEDSPISRMSSTDKNKAPLNDKSAGRALPSVHVAAEPVEINTVPPLPSVLPRVATNSNSTNAVDALGDNYSKLVEATIVVANQVAAWNDTFIGVDDANKVHHKGSSDSGDFVQEKSTRSISQSFKPETLLASSSSSSALAMGRSALEPGTATDVGMDPSTRSKTDNSKRVAVEEGLTEAAPVGPETILKTDNSKRVAVEEGTTEAAPVDLTNDSDSSIDDTGETLNANIPVHTTLGKISGYKRKNRFPQQSLDLKFPCFRMIHKRILNDNGVSYKIDRSLPTCPRRGATRSYLISVKAYYEFSTRSPGMEGVASPSSLVKDVPCDGEGSFGTEDMTGNGIVEVLDITDKGRNEETPGVRDNSANYKQRGDLLPGNNEQNRPGLEAPWLYPSALNTTTKKKRARTKLHSDPSAFATRNEDNALHHKKWRKKKKTKKLKDESFITLDQLEQEMTAVNDEDIAFRDVGPVSSRPSRKRPNHGLEQLVVNVEDRQPGGKKTKLQGSFLPTKRLDERKAPIKIAVDCDTNVDSGQMAPQKNPRRHPPILRHPMGWLPSISNGGVVVHNHAIPAHQPVGVHEQDERNNGTPVRNQNVSQQHEHEARASGRNGYRDDGDSPRDLASQNAKRGPIHQNNLHPEASPKGNKLFGNHLGSVGGEASAESEHQYAENIDLPSQESGGVAGDNHVVDSIIPLEEEPEDVRRIGNVNDPIINMQVGKGTSTRAEAGDSDDDDVSPLERPKAENASALEKEQIRARRIIRSLSQTNRKHKAAISDLEHQQMMLVNVITALLGVSGFLFVACTFFFISSVFS